MEQTRRVLTITIALVALGLPALCAPKARPKPAPKPVVKAKAGKVNVAPGLTMALPAASKVKVRWVCPPLDRKMVEEAHWYSMRFVVDSKGRPWFATEWSNLINPADCYKFKTQRMYEDVACLENGAFLVVNWTDLGFTVPPDTLTLSYDGVPTVLFQPISSLPIRNCRIYAGAGSCLYLVGRNPATKLHDVYLLRQEKLSNKSVGLRDYVKVLSSESPIGAVAGDGNTTYVSMDRVILRTTQATGKLVRVFSSPQEMIKSLAYSPQAGLFYSTFSGIGYLGAKTNMPILAAEDADIYMQKGSLYVLLTETLGVLALDNIGDLKRFDLPAKEVPATQSRDVKVTAVRLFEAGETAPEYADRKYAKEFDKVSARFVYCQVDLSNLSKGKRSHKQMLSVDLIWPKPSQYRDSGETAFEFSKDTPDAWGWVRFGSPDGGYFYPGEYTVKVKLNGSQIDERHFTVQGEPNLMEAVLNRDAAAAGKLLRNGADPNVAGPDGDTPLTIAAAGGHDKLVELLLEHRANVNARDKDGNTALLLASAWNDSYEQIVKLLVEHGADVTVADKEGQTALHTAARHNKTGTMRVLLEHKADPNARDNEGITPFLAMEFRASLDEMLPTQESIELMLSHGANVNTADNKGRTAIEDAVGSRSVSLVRTLVSHGANVNQKCIYSDGSAHSLLYWAIISREIEWDRLKRDDLARIARLLCQNGATLQSDEVEYVLERADWLLDRKQIVAGLDSSNQATFSYRPQDPWLRKYVLKRIMQLAYGNLFNAKDKSYFEAALNCSLLAKERAEEWGLAGEVPEVYFNCGLLAAKTKDAAAAKGYLQRFLALAPNAPNAARAHALLAGM